MPKRVSKVVVTFKVAPISMFKPLGGACCPESNVLVMTLQPDEGVNLQFQVKAPGQPVTLATESLHFRYTEAFSRLADAYETLLLDILNGDRTLFVRADWVETSWALYDRILQSNLDVREYPAGTWGPPAADALPAANGHQWFPL